MNPPSEFVEKLGQVLKVPSKDGGSALELRLDELIQVGTFAGVFVVTDLTSGKEYALKVTPKTPQEFDTVSTDDVDSGYDGSFSLKHMPSRCANEAVSESSNDSALDLMRREACLHGSLADHPHVVKLIAAFEDAECAYLLTELYDDDLYNFIQRGAGPRSSRKDSEETKNWVSKDILENDDAVRILFKQLVEAVEHSHADGIFHRDLKPENVLLDFSNVDSPIGFGIRLADFGLATRATFCKDLACGTRGYLPPESLDPTLDGYDPRLADVWALGVILINLRFQCKLWQAAETGEDSYYTQFLSSPREYLSRTFPVFSNDLIDLLLHVFDPNPEKRATLQDVKAWIESGAPFTRDIEEMDFNSVFDGHWDTVQTQEPAVAAATPVIVTDKHARPSRSDLNDSWWMDSDQEGPVFSPDINTSPASTFATQSPTGVQSPFTPANLSALVSPDPAQPISFVPSSVDSNNGSGMAFSIGSSVGSLMQDAGLSFTNASELPCPLFDSTPYQVRSPKSPSPSGSGTHVTAFTATPDSARRTAQPVPPVPDTPTRVCKTSGFMSTLRKMKDQLTMGKAQAGVENTLECLDAQMSCLRLELEDGIAMGV